jgi:hypothetical protein
LETCLAATESALAAATSEREEAAKRLETAKAKHRDLLNSQVVYSRLAGTRSVETRSKLRLEIRRRVERITFWFQRSADSPRLVEDPAKRAVSVRRSPLHEREMPLHRLNEGSDK